MLGIFPIAWALIASAADGGCSVTFVDGRAPQAPPVATMWAGYGTLRNDSDRPIKVASISSPDFSMSQMHETREEGGVERMHRIDPLIVPAHAQVQFAPRGRHLMLMRPTHSLDEASSLVVEFHVDACVAPVSATLPIVRDREK